MRLISVLLTVTLLAAAFSRYRYRYNESAWDVTTAFLQALFATFLCLWVVFIVFTAMEV